ncbi:MAG: hypothetical protein U1F43_04175 [Myxococcota bacterium]
MTAASTFDFARTLAFLRGFPPCRGDFVIGPDHLSGAFAVAAHEGEDRAVAYTVRAAAGGLAVEADDARVVPMLAAFLGSDDEMDAFYAASEGDIPAYRRIVAALRGLHHVRFPTLAEVTVHAVLAQRTPIAVAGAQKRKVAQALGPRARLGGRELVAFPTLERAAELEPADWSAIVGHAGKSERLTTVVRGVAALGERWLRAAPYPAADQALRAIAGVGPFSAGMILLRGLGRTDDVPLETAGIADVARAVYGPGWDPAATRRRYGTDLGLWSYYLKAGAGHAAPPPRTLGVAPACAMGDTVAT